MRRGSGLCSYNLGCVLILFVLATVMMYTFVCIILMTITICRELKVIRDA